MAPQPRETFWVTSRGWRQSCDRETEKGRLRRSEARPWAAPWQPHQPGVLSVSAEASQQDEVDVSCTACQGLPVSPRKGLWWEGCGMKGRCDSQPERLAQGALLRELPEEDSAAPARAEGSQEQPARGGSHVPGSAPCLARRLFIVLTATRGGGTGSSPTLQLGKPRLRGVN